MRDLTGSYRARGENSKTGGGVVGEMSLAQAGTMLTGTYRFWEERDTEPVTFCLPWHDCDVTGELCKEEIEPRDEEPSYEGAIPGGWDVVLRIGDQDVYGVVITGGHIALSSKSDRFCYCEIFRRQRGSDALAKPLAALIAQLSELGSANDAENHGYSDEADEIRSEAFAEIRKLLDTHPAICEVLPDIRAFLDDGSLAHFGWATQREHAQAYLDAG
jgi:hypothetical protein